MAESWQELQNMTDDEVRARYDVAASASDPISRWRDELVRRENDRIAKKMLCLTWAATIAASASVLVSAIALIYSTRDHVRVEIVPAAATNTPNGR